MSKEESKCEKHFIDTTLRQDDGRYMVTIPFKETIESLGDSRVTALKRFHFLERKLHANDELKTLYTHFINEYRELNHMKPIDESLDNAYEKNYFLPHHVFLKPTSSTTKLRVVFDASAKTSTNKSLNDIMMIGPTVQDNIFNVILRFRTYKYTFSCDIKKMFRQIKINDNQTRLQRIIWRENLNDSLQTFELSTVTYGTASAPYLSTRVLNQLAYDENSNYPLASKMIQRDVFVDDIITGTDNLNEALILQEQTIKLLNSGGFETHKWCSNNQLILENIPVESRETLNFNEFSLGECAKALGLLWQSKEDLLVFKPPIYDLNQCYNKRKILSDTLKFHDPLGLLSPV